MKIARQGHPVNLYFFNDLRGRFWEDGANLEPIWAKKSSHDPSIPPASHT